MAQSMTVARFQQYMLELVATLLASLGFTVSGMSRQNKALEHNGLQASLKNPKENFSALDSHSCCFSAPANELLFVLQPIILLTPSSIKSFTHLAQFFVP